MQVPTDEPLPPELRATVVEELEEDWFFNEIEERRKYLKFAWVDELATKRSKI